jgi:hypothetical protein
MKERLAAFGAGLAAFSLGARVLWPGDAAGWGLNFLLDAAALTAAGVVLAGAEKLRAAHAGFALAGLGVWGALSAFWAGEGLPAAATGASWFAAGALAVACVHGARAAAVHALCGSAGAQAGYAIWQRFWGLPALREHATRHPEELKFLDPKELEEYWARLNTNEPFGTFITSNILCAFLAIALPVLVGRTLDARSWRARLCLAAPIAACAFAALLTKSLGGYAALLAAACVFAWRVCFPEGRRRLVAGVAGAGAALLAAAVLLLAHPGRFDWTNPKTSLGYRANYARGSVGVVEEAPCLGVGASNWGAHYTKYLAPDAGEVQRAHCDLLQVLGELGPLGLALFAAFAFFAARGLLRSEGEPTARRAPVPAEHGPPTTNHGSRVADDGPRSTDLGSRLAFPWPPAIGLAAALAFNEALELRLSGAGVLAAAAILVLLSLALAGSSEAPLGPFTRAGALAAAAAFFVHGTVEYDLYVPGVVFAVAAALGLAAAPETRLRALHAAAIPALAAIPLFLDSPAFMHADAVAFRAHGRDQDLTLDDLRNARRSNPHDPDLPWYEAGFLHALPHHDSAACLAALDDAIRLAPRQAGLRFLRGRFQWDHGQRVEAAKDFQAAVDLYPNLAEHRYWLGRAKREAGDDGWTVEFLEALKVSEKADMPRRRLNPSQTEEIGRWLRQDR